MIANDTLAAAAPFWNLDTPYVSLREVQTVDAGITLDSIFPLREAAVETWHRSMFEGHSLGVHHVGLLERQVGDAPVWVFLLLLLIGVAHYVYFEGHKLHFGGLLKALFSRRSMEHLVRESNLKVRRLWPVAGLIASVAAVVVWIYWGREAGEGWWRWLVVAVGLAAAYLARNGLYVLLGNVFGGKTAVSTFVVSNYCYHLVLSTLLVPLLFLAVYLPVGNEVVGVVIGAMVGICFLMRFARGVNLFLTFSKSASFYLFYYLCSVELLPVVVAVRVFLLQ
ncbi:MAG: DUF4271 domain-containing protein [Bacteroidales bacterium]|nr:DUF4271 domain-containing protein [Bacteroidales bacterium]